MAKPAPGPPEPRNVCEPGVAWVEEMSGAAGATQSIGSIGRIGWRHWASPRYYACVLILAGAALGMRALADYFGWYFRKEALPLKRSLAEFDWSRLQPEYRPHAVQAPPLDAEGVQALGTDQYVQMRLVDTSRPPGDPTSVVSLFITYYTGKPDMVPHVPDECYLAGGYDPVGWPETAEVRVAGVGAPNDVIPVRVVQFQARKGEDRPTVFYFFHVNGDYLANRRDVRVRLGRLLERYSYYAKIEVTLSDDFDDSRRRRFADLKTGLPALERLLRKAMPVLLEDHLAWDRVVSGQPVGRAE